MVGLAGDLPVEHFTIDLRPGGVWRSKGHGADGRTFGVGGVVLEVDPPRLLVQTWNYDWGGGGESILRYRIDPIPGGSRVTVRHEGFKAVGDTESHASGWEHVLGWLAAPSSARVNPRRVWLPVADTGIRRYGFLYESNSRAS